MNNTTYDVYVFLSITESTFRITSKDKSINHNSWCEYISVHLDKQLKDKYIIEKLEPAFRDIIDIYGLSISEAVSHMLKYFEDKLWEKYLPLIVANKNCYGLEMY